MFDKGAGQIEDHAALARTMYFRNHVEDIIACPSHRLRLPVVPMASRVALFEPPGIGHRGDMRWPIRKRPRRSRGRLSRHFPSQRGIELTGALAPVVGGQFVNQFGKRNQHRAALVFALLDRPPNRSANQ